MQLARELAPLCRLRALCSGIRPFASDSTKAIIDNTLVVDTLSTVRTPHVHTLQVLGVAQQYVA